MVGATGDKLLSFDAPHVRGEDHGRARQPAAEGDHEVLGGRGLQEEAAGRPGGDAQGGRVQVPEGMTVNVAVDSEDVRTLVIPLPPTAELSEAELAGIAAADGS